ncbi:hypothetical protein [Bdellovibrio sp. BCCA]|uniref:hypothetical protein n=1 Tax=Bdellovibrio sp. BCCA TaxID=3136281 RepID=UPI0030F35AE3
MKTLSLSMLLGLFLGFSTSALAATPPSLLGQSFVPDSNISRLQQSALGTVTIQLTAPANFPGAGFHLSLEDQQPFFHITRSNSGALLVSFDKGFSADLKSIETTENSAGVLFVSIKSWNALVHPQAHIKVQAFDSTGKSPWVSFVSPLYPLAASTGPASLPELLGQKNQVSSLKTWLDLAFNETIEQASQNALISLEINYLYKNSGAMASVLLMVPTSFTSELTTQVESAVQNWLQTQHPVLENASLVFNVRIFVPGESAGQALRPVYIFNGLELPFTNLN